MTNFIPGGSEMRKGTRAANRNPLNGRTINRKLDASARSNGTTTPANDDLFLQPWFMPLDVCLEMRRLIPSAHLAKMKYYYEDFGCLRCGEHKPIYGSNGFCEGCSVLVRGRIERSLKRRLKKAGVLDSANDVLSGLRDGMTSAQRLLRHHRIRPVQPRS